jgi:Brp/Blh family beta-carotene 15,15'-monooxygenase
MAVVTDSLRVTRRPVMLGVSGLLAGFIVAAAVGIHFSGAVQYVPFVVSLVLFGLPHGALDHLVPARLAGVRPTLRSIATVVALYLILGCAVIGLWFVAPAFAALGFIALTWFHWGQGDLYALVTFTKSSYLNTRGLRALALAVRGGLPMLVPLIAWPELYRHVLGAAAGLFSTAGPLSGGQLSGGALSAGPHSLVGPELAWLSAPGTRVAVAVGFGALVVSYLVLTHRRVKARSIHSAGALGIKNNADSLRAWRVDAAETALLALFFVLVPPILAVGLYFCLWHAVRHILRLGALGHSTLRQFSRDAAPITAISLGMYLVLLSALTLPHVVIVSWMDARQHLWR